MTTEYHFAVRWAARRAVLIFVFLAAVFTTVPAQAKSKNVTDEYRNTIEKMLRPFDDYFGYGCNVDSTFSFDNCAKTTMLCMKNVNYFGLTLRRIRDINLSDWKRYFDETPAFTMKKHSGSLYEGSPSQWSNPSYLIQLVDGKARYLGGIWENLVPRGEVKKVVQNSDRKYTATYDVSWCTRTGTTRRLMGTYKITLKPSGNRYGFAITDIRRTGAQVPAPKLEKNNCTQAIDLFFLGRQAYMGNDAARKKMTAILANIVKKENASYGLKVSVILAKLIEESGWVSYQNTSGYLLHGANNIVGMNYGNFDSSGDAYAYDELINSGSRWDAYQTWIPADVTQWDSSGNTIGTHEAMKSFKCIEDCVEDFMAVIVKRSPKLRNNQNIEAYRSFLQSYTPYGDQVSIVQKIIRKYNLSRHDQ